MNSDAYKSTLDKIVESLEGDSGPSSPVLGPLERIAIALEDGAAPENPYLDPLERIAKVVQEGGGGGGSVNFKRFQVRSTGGNTLTVETDLTSYPVAYVGWWDFAQRSAGLNATTSKQIFLVSHIPNTDGEWSPAAALYTTKNTTPGYVTSAIASIIDFNDGRITFRAGSSQSFANGTWYFYFL